MDENTKKYTSEGLKTLREKCVKEARTVHDTAELEGRGLSPDEQKTFDEKMRLAEEYGRELDLRKSEGRKDADLRMGAPSSVGTLWTADGHEYRSYEAEKATGANQDVMTDIASMIRAKIDPHFIQDLSKEQRAIFNISDDSQGGFVLPAAQSAEWLKVARDSTIVANQCRLVELPNGSDTKFAGINTDPTATWSGEGGSISEGEIVFQGITLRPKRVASYLKLSMELARAPNALAEIGKSLRFSVAQALDKSILTGDGDVEPRGLDNLDNIGSEDKSGAAVTIDDVIGGYWRIRKNNGPDKVSLIMNGQQSEVFSKKKDGEGRYVLSSPGGLPDIWQSIRRYSTEVIDTDTSNYSTVYMGNFSESLLGHVPEVEILISKEAYDGTDSAFQKGLVFVRVIAWYDWNAGPKENWFYRIYNGLVS